VKLSLVVGSGSGQVAGKTDRVNGAITIATTAKRRLAAIHSLRARHAASTGIYSSWENTGVYRSKRKKTAHHLASAFKRSTSSGSYKTGKALLETLPSLCCDCHHNSSGLALRFQLLFAVAYRPTRLLESRAVCAVAAVVRCALYTPGMPLHFQFNTF
jgi:hypothetical protein